jgi:hypothetical protein
MREVIGAAPSGPIAVAHVVGEDVDQASLSSGRMVRRRFSARYER